jgi:tetratricopeptide (TPR) repeat protein
VLGVLTYRQVSYWHDAETFWRRTLAGTENNYIANRDLASVLHEHGRDAEAIPFLQEALAINPHDLLSNMYMGAHEEAHGDLAAARDRFQYVALRAEAPKLRAEANRQLGTVYWKMGDAGKAKDCFEHSLQLVHDQPELMVTVGVMAQKSGDLAEALRQYERADGLQHTDVEELLVAQALQLEGRTEQAKAVFKRAARMSPDLAKAQQNVAMILRGN